MPKPFENIKINKTYFQKIENKNTVPKDISGLQNIGNTCFMNSIIQCLRHDYQLSSYFISDKYLNEISENKNKVHIELLENWVEIIKLLIKNNVVIVPHKFLGIVQKLSIILDKQFIGFNQNDAQEFLQFIMECMHESLEFKVNITIDGEQKNELDKLKMQSYKEFINYFKKSYSIITEYYYGQYISSITNNKDKEISYSFDPFCSLSLEIPENKDDLDIYDCLNHFCKEEKIELQKKNYTKDTIFKKNIHFINLPQRLIIFFKRYNNKSKKINKLINFPLKLNMSKYSLDERNIYNLYGICYHKGTIGTGHYYAICKNLTKNNGKILWFEYNDANRKFILEKDLPKNDAYCLFYERL